MHQNQPLGACSALSPYHPAQADHLYQPDESIEIETYTGEDVLFGKATAIMRIRHEVARAGRALKRAPSANRSSWRLYRDSLRADLDQVLNNMSREETKRVAIAVKKRTPSYPSSPAGRAGSTMGFYHPIPTQVRRCA